MLMRFIGLIISAMVFVCAHAPAFAADLQTDAEMIERFNAIKPDLIELRDMFIEDQRNKLVVDVTLKGLEEAAENKAPDGPRSDLAKLLFRHNDASKLPAERRSRYISLLTKLGIKLLRGSEDGVQFTVFGSDFLGWSKNYVWARDLEQYPGLKVLPSLDFPLAEAGFDYQNAVPEFHAYRRIEDGWYLMFRGDNLPAGAKKQEEGLKELPCISLAEVRNDYLTVELFTALRKCATTEQWAKAADLYWMLGAYGFFDNARMADKTGSLMGVFLRHLADGLTEQQQSSLQAAIDVHKADNKNICKEIKRIGPPAYDFGAADIVPGFDASKAWPETLKDLLKCV